MEREEGEGRRKEEELDLLEYEHKPSTESIESQSIERL